MAKFCWSLALRSMAHNNIAHDIVGKKNKAFAIISRSAKSLGNLLDGNNVTEIIVIRHSVWRALDYRIIEMHLALGVMYSLLII